MMNRMTLWAVLAALVLLFVAACGADDAEQVLTPTRSGR